MAAVTHKKTNNKQTISKHVKMWLNAFKHQFVLEFTSERAQSRLFAVCSEDKYYTEYERFFVFFFCFCFCFLSFRDKFHLESNVPV